MVKSTSRIVVMALVLVTLVALGTAWAAGPCIAAAAANTPGERADLFRQSLERFGTNHADLTTAQRQFITQSARLGEDLGATQPDARAEASLIRKAKTFVERSHELFTNNQLGELFTSMGSVQHFFAAAAAAAPFCNCIGQGDCVMGPGGPTGTCAAGCQSWDGSDGFRRDGICSPKAVEAPVTPADH
jgi:hypothetical protein